LAVIALGVLAGFIYTRFDYKYGLDVKGGVRFTYQMDTSKLTAEQKGSLGSIREKVQTILINRASGSFGVAEPVVVPKGEDQFVIELPGFTNIDEARSIIGTSARIEIYDATTVVTEKKPFNLFVAAEKDDITPIVNFRRSSSPTAPEIVPGTPEYENMIKGWKLILSGDDLANASAQPAGDSFQPLMNFSAAGSAKMEEWSRKNINSGARIATVLDGKVLSIARLNDNTILSSNAVITGTFKPEYVTRLVDLLNAGSLPVDLKELSS